MSSAEWASSKIPSAKWSQARWYWIFIQRRRLFVTVFPETEQHYRQTFNFFFNRYYFSSNWWLLLFRFWSIFGPSRFWLSLIANHKICGFKYISWGFCRLEFLGYANNQFVKAGFKPEAKLFLLDLYIFHFLFKKEISVSIFSLTKDLILVFTNNKLFSFIETQSLLPRDKFDIETFLRKVMRASIIL